MKKLAIVTSHPIQYNAPWFQMLSQRGKVQVKVFYTWSQSREGNNFDPGFGKAIGWDIPLLDGYDFTFVENVAKEPGSHHYKGLVNPSLNHEIDLWNPDALLVLTWAHRSHLSCMRYFHKKIPVLFRGDSTLLNEQPGVRKWTRTMFLRWVYRHVSYGMYVGTNNRNYYLRHGLKQRQLVFAPHAIDNARFSHNELQYSEEALAWRNKIGINGEAVVFLYAGKLEEVKNPELLVEAFKELKCTDVHLIMVGNGPNEKQLKIENSSVGNIHFIDFQNQSKMPVVYHLADVFVLPSRSETWGLSLNEAMACRKALLVSSRCGAAVDLVEEGRNGYIFESGNKRSIVEKMEQLYASREKLKSFGQRSFEIVLNYSFEQICEAFERLLCGPQKNKEVQ